MFKVRVMFYMYFFSHHRTLLALGCRVVQVNPNAEDSLKKIKLPKKYVLFSYDTFLNYLYCKRL